MYAHLGWIAVAFAATGLLKYAIDQNDRWWRLILIVLALAAVTAGLLFVLGSVRTAGLGAGDPMRPLGAPRVTGQTGPNGFSSAFARTAGSGRAASS